MNPKQFLLSIAVIIASLFFLFLPGRTVFAATSCYAGITCGGGSGKGDCTPSDSNCTNQCPAGWTWCNGGMCYGSGNDPAKAGNLSPANNATGVSLTPTLSWTAPSSWGNFCPYPSTGGNLYKVYLFDPGVGTLVNGYNNGTSRNFNVSPALQSSHTYTWRIDTYNSVFSTTGNLWTFTTAGCTASAPTVPTSLSATNITTTGATGNWSPPTSWNDCGAGGDYYKIILPYTTTPGSPVSNVTSPDDFSGLTVGTNYSWQVAACNAAGCSSFVTSTFTTLSCVSQIPTVPNSPSISNITSFGATANWLSPTTWGSCNSSENTYKVNLNGFLYQGGLTATSYVITGQSPNTTYTWSVSACNNAGCSATVPSPDGSFTTLSCTVSSPNAFSLTAPTNGLGVGPTPLFQWGSSTPANSCNNTLNYTVYVDNVAQTATSTLSWQPSAPLSSTTHSWYVKACNESQCTNSTQTNWTFTVSCTPTSTCTSPYSGCTQTCISSKVSYACPDGCGGTYTCSTNNACTSNPNAGLVSSQGTVNPGSGAISQGGTSRSSDPSLNINLLTSGIDYQTFLVIVTKNAALTPSLVNDKCTASPTGDFVSDNGKFHFWCYGSAVNPFDTTLNSASTNTADASTVMEVVVPNSYTYGDQTISTAKNPTRSVIVFTNGNLSVNSPITINSSSTLVSISSGNLNISQSISRLDGVYIFSGTFDDKGGSIQLKGSGSLIGTSESAFSASGLSTLTRSSTANDPICGNAGECWSYDPKYLDIYRNILAAPKYTWQELPPN